MNKRFMFGTVLSIAIGFAAIAVTQTAQRFYHIYSEPLYIAPSCRLGSPECGIANGQFIQLVCDNETGDQYTLVGHFVQEGGNLNGKYDMITFSGNTSCQSLAVRDNISSRFEINADNR